LVWAGRNTADQAVKRSKAITIFFMIEFVAAAEIGFEGADGVLPWQP
jgi:hypothetical protein